MDEELRRWKRFAEAKHNKGIINHGNNNCSEHQQEQIFDDVNNLLMDDMSFLGPINFWVPNTLAQQYALTNFVTFFNSYDFFWN